jgi:hypothetical protein
MMIAGDIDDGYDSDDGNDHNEEIDDKKRS